MSWSAQPPNPLPPDVNRHWILDLTAWIGTGLATILIVARVFTRYHLLGVANWGDAVMVISGLLAIVATSLQTVTGPYGAGRHIWYLSEEDITKASLYGTVAVPFAQMAMALPKIAAAAVLLRIAGPTAGRKTKVYFYFITIFLAFISILYCIFIFVQCTPVFALWTMAAKAKCWPRQIVGMFGLVTCVVSVFVDINLAVYPIFIIKKLQMSLRKKITICVMMGLGTSATVCAGFKIPHLQDQASPDITFDIIDLSTWTLAEMNLILISACVPLLRPLWLWMRGKPITGSTAAAAKSAGGRSLPNHRSPGPDAAGRRGFMMFGAKHDSDLEHGYSSDSHEMTVDVAYDTQTTHGGDGRALTTPPPAHDIKVEKTVVITHEAV